MKLLTYEKHLKRHNKKYVFSYFTLELHLRFALFANRACMYGSERSIVAWFFRWFSWRL